VSSETIAALLAARAGDLAAKPAIIDDDGAVTYAELDRRSAEIAAVLVRQGLNKGHRTGLMAPNGADWALIAYAVMRIGAVLVPLSTLLRPPELQQHLAVAGVRHLILCDAYRGRDYRSEAAALDRPALPALADIWWMSELAGLLPGPEERAVADALAARARPADDMAVMFTSGSRGAPKGVIHTHGGAIRATAAGLEARCIEGATRLYIPMPFFWMGGFGGGLISTLVAGATLVTERTPEPGRTLRLLQDHEVTLFRGWPDQALSLTRHPDFSTADLSRLRPGSLDPVLPEALRGPPGARANLFGMTESFGPYCGWRLDRDLPKDAWGSCGKPFEGVAVRIVDPETGAGGPARATGALQFCGPNLMRAVCGREREAVFTVDGWYDSGDLGRLDADGFLFFSGRRDDMFKLRGASVYPLEVEQALAALPGVRRAFACEIEVDGAPAVGAAVLGEDGANLDLAGLHTAARQRLSAFKVPSRWVMLDALEQVPTLASGKVDPVALRALLTAGATAN
jgi:acyl-CoA synthetase (AMP-forming)/AMP-acid ligase II